MPLDFTITTSSDSISKESPIILNDLVELLTNHLEPLDVDTIDTNQLNTFILKQCQLKSSKYKFLVQSTKLSSPNTVDSDLDISSTFGAVWDDNKDGYISLKLDVLSLDENNQSIINTILITVFWIFII